MPNWCQGTLKIRGDAGTIKKFMHEGLEVYNRSEDGNMVSEPPRYNDWGDLLNVGKYGYIYVLGTRRGFVEHILSCWDAENDEELALFYKQAWKIESKELREIARKFKLNMRIQGFECGCEFMQDVEVDSNGNVIKDDVLTCDDYFWECPFPTLGG